MQGRNITGQLWILQFQSYPASRADLIPTHPMPPSPGLASSSILIQLITYKLHLLKLHQFKI